MSFPIALPVVLNGSRSYVQGSQIVCRALEKMAPMGAQDLVSVGFHKITDCLVSLTETPDETAKNTLGELIVRDSDGARRRLYLVADETVAPRDTRPQSSQIEKLDQTAPLSARFSITAITDMEDIFDSLVQSVKGLHEELGEDVKDVWFTGLRGRVFPIQPSEILSSGTLMVDFSRIMKSNDRWQTLMGFSICDLDGREAYSGALTFAFKSEAKPNVD